jgi:excisionase family DNA binding protein
MADRTLMRIRDAAIATDTSDSTVIRAIRRGDLKVFRIGGTVRIDRGDLEEWLARSRGDASGKRRQNDAGTTSKGSA